MPRTGLFAELHAGLRQQGPGSDASTGRALALMPTLPRGARVLDMGCGPGRQTLALARLTDAVITAVDLVEPFLELLRERCAESGLAERVHTVCASMTSDRFEREPVDLIWSEGAIYNVGFEKGLRHWRAFLRPGGCAALTELSWLVADPPRAAREFWERAYPEMGSVAENQRLARRAGYEPIAHFALPESDWWDGYYGPLEERDRILRAKYAGDPAALAELDKHREEIDLYREHADAYGYVFYLLRAL